MLRTSEFTEPTGVGFHPIAVGRRVRRYLLLVLAPTTAVLIQFALSVTVRPIQRAFPQIQLVVAPESHGDHQGLDHSCYVKGSDPFDIVFDWNGGRSCATEFSNKYSTKMLRRSNLLFARRKGCATPRPGTKIVGKTIWKSTPTPAIQHWPLPVPHPAGPR